jgi:uncharacterized protein (DUF2141 family)
MSTAKILFWLLAVTISFLCDLSPVLADSDTFKVEGTATFPKSGDIYLQLLDEGQFKTDMAGKDPHTPYRLVLKVRSAKSVVFRFDGVPKGTYVLSGFQDVVGDGKIHLGLFGPTVPWGYYGKRPSFVPNFKEESFSLNRDLTNIVLEIK